jgi:hypothetical protein
VVRERETLSSVRSNGQRAGDEYNSRKRGR